VRANDRALARMAQFDILCILSRESILRRELKPLRASWDCVKHHVGAVQQIARSFSPRKSGLTSDLPRVVERHPIKVATN
jgi:hypothetical protein